MRHDITLGGIQASGKDTQAQFLADAGYQLLGMGESLRERAAVGDELGQNIQEILDTGSFVSDDVIYEVIRSKMESMDLTKPICFNGFPRKFSQHEIFERLLEEKGRRFVAVLIDVSKEEALARIEKRRETEDRADDQDMASIENRISNFITNTLPIYEDYEEAGRLLRVNGQQSIDEVREEMLRLIDAFEAAA